MSLAGVGAGHELDPVAIVGLQLADQQPGVVVDDLDRVTVRACAAAVELGTFAVQRQRHLPVP